MELYVLLDNIRSKFNVGSIFRTAEAFNFKKVILTGFTPQIPDTEISKTALGAEKFVNWQYWQNPSEALKFLKSQKIKIIIAETWKNSQPLDKFTFPKSEPLCLVLGNEITGVSPKLKPFADEIVSIPMLGTIKESLNVSVAFGILAAFCKIS